MATEINICEMDYHGTTKKMLKCHRTKSNILNFVQTLLWRYLSSVFLYAFLYGWKEV